MVVLTSRLSLRAYPWLADHAVHGVVLFPGTGFVELAVRGADAVGAGGLRELVVEAPLVIPERDSVQVQVVVNDDDTLGIYSRATDDDPWVRHATAVTGSGDDRRADFGSWPWPPVDASPVDVADFYQLTADSGFVYGPVFQGLRRVWRGDGEVFAEVVVPEGEVDRARKFGVHPALLDAALQAMAFVGLDPAPGGWLPFSFADVTLHAVGATVGRVRVVRTGPDSVGVELVDGDGDPVVSIGSLVLRPVSAGGPVAGVRAGTMLAVDWSSVVTLEDPAPGTDVVVFRAADDIALDGIASAGVVVLEAVGVAGGMPRSAHEVTGWVLAQVQRWLVDDRCVDGRLVVVTRGAVAVDPGEPVGDVAAAAVWGLVRSAQAEHPGRITLLDTD
ncbi:polyketide synthase dehydratase domain-containing protein, partial [Streptomyces ferralitis]